MFGATRIAKGQIETNSGRVREKVEPTNDLCEAVVRWMAGPALDTDDRSQGPRLLDLNMGYRGNTWQVGCGFQLEARALRVDDGSSPNQDLVDRKPSLWTNANSRRASVDRESATVF